MYLWTSCKQRASLLGRVIPNFPFSAVFRFCEFCAPWGSIHFLRCVDIVVPSSTLLVLALSTVVLQWKVALTWNSLVNPRDRNSPWKCSAARLLIATLGCCCFFRVLRTSDERCSTVKRPHLAIKSLHTLSNRELPLLKWSLFRKIRAVKHYFRFFQTATK